ncbi:MAG: (2Fe-2S) ferredoxin domain-containing protein [Pseudomonadota bacterium]
MDAVNSQPSGAAHARACAGEQQAGSSDALARAVQGEAVLFVVSAYALSKRAFERLQSAALSAADAASMPAQLIRLEDSEPTLVEALDAMRAEGFRAIRMQPLGVPFPESLLAWLPGVLADWRMRGDNSDTQVELGPDPATDADALAALAAASLGQGQQPKPIDHRVKPRLGKPGWTDPPDFDFHLLVCTGPRCTIHGAASFSHMLRDELKAAGIFDRCLTTRTGCIFPCNRGPILALYPHGNWFRLPDLAATRRFVREVLVRGESAEDLRFHTARAVRANPIPPNMTNLEETPQ